MARHAAWVCANENPAGVYFGLHHLGYDHIPHICAGIANKLQKLPKYAVKAQHVTYAGLLLVDVDPTRPSGVCLTDLEKAAAWKVTESVRVYLTTSGWSEPIVVNSGKRISPVLAFELRTGSSIMAVPVELVGTDVRHGRGQD